MKNRTQLALCALITPAATFMLGVGTALAAETPALTTGSMATAAEKKIPELTTGPKSATTEMKVPELTTGSKVAATEMKVPELTAGSKSAATEMKMPSAPATATIIPTSTVLTSGPTGSLSADDLLGKKIHHRGNDKSIGEINDLIIDKDGQIVAVIVEVGGFLGIGEKNVAINWNSLDRTAKKTGKGYDLSVDSTEKTLTDAPVYKRN